MKKTLLFAMLSAMVGALHGAETKKVQEMQRYTCQETPLINAALRGDVKEVKKLLQEDAQTDIEERDVSDAALALMVAASRGHKDVVRVLLDSGVNIETKIANDWTALMLAAQNGHVNVVEVLEKAGADKETKNAYGMTALMVAAYNGRSGVVRLLLQKGAEVNVSDGKNALLLAVNRQVADDKNYIEVVRLLLGMPSLSQDTLDAINTSGQVLSARLALVKNIKNGNNAAFFTALETEDLKEIEAAVSNLNNDISLYYVPQQTWFLEKLFSGRDEVLWNNPIHYVLIRHDKRMSKIQTTSDVRKQKIRTINILQFLTKQNPNLWFEKNSEKKTPINLVNSGWLLEFVLGGDLPELKHMMEARSQGRKARKKLRQRHDIITPLRQASTSGAAGQSSIVPAQASVVTSSSPSLVSTAPQKVGKAARARLKQRIESKKLNKKAF